MTGVKPCYLGWYENCGWGSQVMSDLLPERALQIVIRQHLWQKPDFTFHPKQTLLQTAILLG